MIIEKAQKPSTNSTDNKINSENLEKNKQTKNQFHIIYSKNSNHINSERNSFSSKIVKEDIILSNYNIANNMDNFIENIGNNNIQNIEKEKYNNDRVKNDINNIINHEINPINNKNFISNNFSQNLVNQNNNNLINNNQIIQNLSFYKIKICFKIY